MTDQPIHADTAAAWALWRRGCGSELTDNEILKALWRKIKDEGRGDGFWDIDPHDPATFIP